MPGSTLMQLFANSLKKGYNTATSDDPCTPALWLYISVEL